MESTETIHLMLLGQTRAVIRSDQGERPLRIQAKPTLLLAYLALHAHRPQRRETLQALFWPDKTARQAANNLRQVLWHLRRALPPDTLFLEGDTVRWNPAAPPWVDALAFEEALQAEEWNQALDLYAGPLLPEAYQEWVQIERERFFLHYLSALENRARARYQLCRWDDARADAERLQSADPLNETAVRLLMASYWALGQREAARRCFDTYQERVHQELGVDPLPETRTLYQRILRGEAHPDQSYGPADTDIARRSSHLSLLETLGAFRQGMEQAITWAKEAEGVSRAAALRWQGRFHLRLGQLPDGQGALNEALALAESPDLRAAILADLASTETGLGDYSAAEAHYAGALELLAPDSPSSLRILSSMGGLQGRQGRIDEARRTLERAVRLCREQSDPAPLAIASGNLGIMLIGQGEAQPAEAALLEALEAARQADAHWLTAHLTGHLGVLAQDRRDLETAGDHYQRARTLAETIGDGRCATLWTLNLGVVRYEQERYDEALPLLSTGKEQAAEQGARSLEAGAGIFGGACLAAQGRAEEGLSQIQEGLGLARKIGDQERILMGLLHRARALATIGALKEAQDSLEEGLRRAQASQMQRLEGYLRAELEALPPRQ